ncbi:bifunctional DNA-formamidopyrimidine glycosylase/DNA-(apurinic or apyrimidinic site) lyase [Rhizobium alvei]|uniref:Formamidopyrimidine-DNA glycosylase n=1 Tax=Rhizobium alvei TaxID=1132659 RepID=A0ABT8YQH6_9HYPH|nr:bifunctional DNA-formamidopyrimidine glycosylase/DNA-(apurinic or apyrimidinic site) lyase [Rhizobium alvei]MDO6965572.1 bifunctional DNA-formamidopyrimidine glycosylase/DNA-(apurinic or apyrimidinic site) lyase [Rhizobium alvei]
MPELPEVETVRRGLEPFMQGRQIETLVLNRADLRFPFPADLRQVAEGRKVERLGRRAKYLLIELEGDATIIAHLGMSGSFRIDEDVPGQFHHPRGKDAAHDHVVFHLSGQQGPVRITYNDPRRFGFMDLVRSSEIDRYPAFAALGPEPLGNALSADYLAERLSRSRQPLKSALLDQSVIAGLGNIYVCEALHRSGLSPLRIASSLVAENGSSSPKLEELARQIRVVIEEAIEAGGSSLRDHIQTDGSLGYFQHRFRAYDREGAACITPGCKGTIERITQSGRSTFFCAACQE